MAHYQRRKIDGHDNSWDWEVWMSKQRINQLEMATKLARPSTIWLGLKLIDKLMRIVLQYKN